MKEHFELPIEISVEIANLERGIGHMETDLSFHQSQVRLFEEKVRKDQKRLHDLRKSTQRYFHTSSHSSCDDSEFDEGKDHEM